MNLLITLWFSLFTLAFGGYLLKVLGCPSESTAERGAFAFALGFGVIGYVILFFGLAGVLYRPVIMAFFFCASLLLYTEIKNWILLIGQGASRFFSREGNAKFYALLLWFSLMLIFAFRQSQLPPTANDALVYHLYIPKRFVQLHQVTYLPYLVNSLFPFLIQMHYALAILIGRPELSGTFHLLTALGTSAGVYALSRRYLSSVLSVVAGMVFFLTPGIYNQMVEPSTDVALAFFSLFAVYAFLRMLNRKGDLRYAALAGIFSGFALSIKYLALLHIGILGLLALVFSWKRISFKRIFLALLVYTVITILCSFIWYLRSWIHEGNPVYPFFPSVFGGTGHEYDLQKQGFGKGILDLILLWYRVTLYPQKFGGTWAWLGIIIPLALPWVLIRRWKNPEQTFLYLFSVVFFILWFYSVQNLRFLFPVIPVLSILIVLAVERWIGVLILLLLVHSAFAFYRGRTDLTHWLQRETPEQYLMRVERTYPLSRWVNQNIPSSARVLNMGDMRMFYFDPEMIREKEYRKKTRYPDQYQNPVDVISRLQSDGIDYLFYWDKSGKDIPPMAVPALLQNVEFRQKYLDLIYEETSSRENPYQFYKIKHLDENSGS